MTDEEFCAEQRRLLDAMKALDERDYHARARLKTEWLALYESRQLTVDKEDQK